MANANGTPIWFELTTPDKDAAEKFYAAVAGWSVVPSPVPEHGGYRLAGPGNAGVAGLMTPPPGTPAGPSGWSIYFASDDVDAMVDAVKSLGGAVHFGPMDIPQVGRFAVCSDPQGVTFSIMKGASTEDSQAFKQGAGSHGHGVWVELATPDPDAAIDFYAALFGWSKQGGMPMGQLGEYSFIGRAKDDCPGAVMSSVATGAKARWNWYILVPDIDAAIETSKAGGGMLIQGPDEIPGGDYSANLIDAQGFEIGIVGSRRH